jgi:hypothetical protein
MGWRYGQRFCESDGCSRELAADARADKRYCGDRCRKREERSQRLRLANDVRDWLSDDHWNREEAAARIPGRDAALAASAPYDVMAGTLEITNYNGPRWKARAEQVKTDARICGSHSAGA